MRRLYQKIYLVFLASLIAVVVTIGLAWRIGQVNSAHSEALDLAGELAGAALPPDAPPPVLQRVLERLAGRSRIDIALFDKNRALVVRVGRPLPQPIAVGESGGWLRGRGGPAWSFRLPDGRWLVARKPLGAAGPLLGLVFFLTAMAIAIAIFAYPVVRSLTKRIERLQGGVETLGAGNLATRVAVEGRDEVAQLAASFNRAASRIEELVGAHRLLLANASHELRTPLSRIRLGIELFEAKPEPKIKAELARDIAELDDLIEEILLASRLDVAAAPPATEDVDLLALVAEECAHYNGATLDGELVVLRGDARLLRRLVRNLLDNAQRHGRPPIRVELRRSGSRASLSVIDGGDGIVPSEREHVFLPFHRLRGDRKGAGLGLALVRQIARLHGGDATVTPRPDASSCIVVELAAVQPCPVGATLVVAPLPEDAANRATTTVTPKRDDHVGRETGQSSLLPWRGENDRTQAQRGRA
jgi:signal transduction histidine kinase